MKKRLIEESDQREKEYLETIKNLQHLNKNAIVEIER
jgi:hypothetical protein